METEERIIQGAHELFFRYGIRSVTMDDVCSHLGISKRTIYEFFKDKDEIVLRLMREKCAGDRAAMEGITASSANVVEEVFSLMKHFEKVIREINPHLFYDLQKYHPQAWKMFREFRDKEVLQRVEDTLVRGISQGLLRKDIQVKILAKLRLEEIDMGFNPELFSGKEFRITDVHLALTEHFLYGVCTLKGHKLINKYKQIIEEE